MLFFLEILGGFIIALLFTAFIILFAICAFVDHLAEGMVDGIGSRCSRTGTKQDDIHKKSFRNYQKRFIKYIIEG